MFLLKDVTFDNIKVHKKQGFSKALIDSNISSDELVLINNVLKEYDNMKEEIKNLKT